VKLFFQPSGRLRAGPLELLLEINVRPHRAV
jgi:hypothetical protein